MPQWAVTDTKCEANFDSKRAERKCLNEKNVLWYFHAI